LGESWLNYFGESGQNRHFFLDRVEIAGILGGAGPWRNCMHKYIVIWDKGKICSSGHPISYFNKWAEQDHKIYEMRLYVPSYRPKYSGILSAINGLLNMGTLSIKSRYLKTQFVHKSKGLGVVNV